MILRIKQKNEREINRKMIKTRTICIHKIFLIVLLLTYLFHFMNKINDNRLNVRNLFIFILRFIEIIFRLSNLDLI